MSTRTRDVERLLAEQPVASPPAGLADRIKAEIPETVEVAPNLAAVPSRSKRTPWQLWKVAAVLMPLLMTAVLTRHLVVHYQAVEDQLAGLAEPPATEIPEQVARPAAAVQPPPPMSAGHQELLAAAPVPTVPDGRQEPQPAAAVPVEPVQPVATPAPVGEPRAVATTEEAGKPSAPSRTPVPVRLGEGDGQITAQITYENGPMPGVTATLHNPALNGTVTVISGINGEVRFPFLPEGEYKLRVELDRFQTLEQNLKLTGGGQKAVDVRMVPEPVSEEIVVTSNYETVRDGAQISSTAEPDVQAMLARARNVTPATALATAGKNETTATQPVVAGKAEAQAIVLPSTGGTSEPNDQPYGDVFFREYGVNPFIDTEDDHLSTFGLEVDTGSYGVIRRYLRDGHLPPREAVRIEELLNSFDYGDRPPTETDFALHAEGAPSPFGGGERYYLLRFGIKGRVVSEADRPPAVLTFVIDVSGSMDRENRLGLVKQSLYELLDNLRSDDRVGLVIYGSRGEVLLEPTADHQAIRSAITRLQPGGATNAEEGLVLAYELAARNRRPGTINRLILCSDGVANVGRTGPDSIFEQVRRYAQQGIELTTVGFGMGNYNDLLMEQLADIGNGRYAYVDALPEARRLFVDELSGTLLTIGHDAKVQVEFNPEVVARYRLLGYENRDIADERFRDPTVDAGEIGAGHSVTALYELKLHRSVWRRRTLATLRLRYRPMGAGQEPVELQLTVHRRDLTKRWDRAPASLRLATLVAEFGEILKGSYWARNGDLQQVLHLAPQLSPELADDTRVADFVSLVAAAAELQPSGQSGSVR